MEHRAFFNMGFMAILLAASWVLTHHYWTSSSETKVELLAVQETVAAAELQARRATESADLYVEHHKEREASAIKSMHDERNRRREVEKTLDQTNARLAQRELQFTQLNQETNDLFNELDQVRQRLDTAEAKVQQDIAKAISIEIDARKRAALEEQQKKLRMARAARSKASRLARQRRASARNAAITRNAAAMYRSLSGNR